VATLYLGGNGITDVGAKALAEALTVNSSLEELDLAYNEIGDTDAKSLAEALTTNTSLKFSA